MKSKKWVVCIAVLILNTLCSLCIAQTPKLIANLNEEIITVPEGSGFLGVKLQTTIFKPAGDGPFPILVMNHGKSSGNTHFQPRARFVALARIFVHRGYAVVVPMRKGFGDSTGMYVNGGCNIASNGRAQAEDVEAVLNYVVQQPWADKDRIIVAGASQGGLATLAFGTLNFPGVRGLINFAGGLQISDCTWENSLIHAFEDYASHTTVPSIWFYGENDSFFNPEVAAKLYAAYTGAGGHAKLVAYGPFKQDSHTTVESADGMKILWPEMKQFLKNIGMPTELITQAPL